MDKWYIEKEIKRLMWIERFFIDENYDEMRLVKDIGTSRMTLRQVLKDSFDTTFGGLRNRFKIKEAKHIMALKHKKFNIGDVALMCGFNNRQTFAKQFKLIEGVSPGLYLRKERKKWNF